MRVGRPSAQSKPVVSLRCSVKTSGQARSQPPVTVLVTWSLTLAVPSVGRPSSYVFTVRVRATTWLPLLATTVAPEVASAARVTRCSGPYTSLSRRPSALYTVVVDSRPARSAEGRVSMPRSVSLAWAPVPEPRASSRLAALRLRTWLPHLSYSVVVIRCPGAAELTCCPEAFR